MLMVIYTDSIAFAQQVLPTRLAWATASLKSIKGEIKGVATNLFETASLASSNTDWNQNWQYLFIVKSASQSPYDVLIKLAQENESLPNGILCLAGSGSKLHGYKDRPWVALPGNIHLCAYLAPQQKIDHFGVGFTILSAVSVAETLDSIEGLRQKASLKWVNDILIDKAKVAGVLAHTQSQGELVTAAVLGIGLNVESTPSLQRDPFVPRVASLRDYVRDPQKCSQAIVFAHLAKRLDKNYQLLLTGQYHRLLDLYRQRSAIIGKKVTIYADMNGEAGAQIATGTVTSIGENLELYLDGLDTPISKGRLVLKS
jgi:BirA family biotin operon repressor/biotin-[acetyl-CoA-carboxylase] ligase